MKKRVIDLIENYQSKVLPFTKKYLKNSSVLDLGCGSGMTAVILSKKLDCNFFLTDVIDVRDSLAKSFPFSIASADKLPYLKNQFNVVYAQFLLHHLEPNVKLIKVLNEAYRVSSDKLIIIEETISKKTNMDNALDFDERTNLIVHPGIKMKVFHYYSHEELTKLIKKTYWKILETKLLDPGNKDNGFLETRLYVLKK